MMTKDPVNYPEETKLAASYLRKAVPLMVERDIPANPKNYALWYTYVSDKNPELKQQLDQNFPGKGSYNADTSDKLFYEYFVKEFLPNNQKAQESMANMLAAIFSNVQKAAKGTQDYGESLRTGMLQIQNSGSMEELTETLDQLIKDTEAVNRVNSDFQSELDQARQEIDQLKQELSIKDKIAQIDELTQIGNRRSFDNQLTRSFTEEGQTCLLLFDLDHFKKFNDTYGHLMGDRVLTAVGQLLSKLQSDKVFVARYGGEEFAAIVDDSLENAQALAESIRQKMQGIRIRKGDSAIDHITASIGVAQRRTGETEDALIQRVDEALYKAKENGRNCVMTAG